MANDPSSSELLQEQHLDALCDRFELAWRDNQTPRLAAYLDEAPQALRLRVLAELWAIELHYRRDEQGTPLSEAQLARMHPLLAQQLEELPTMDAGVGATPAWGIHVGPSSSSRTAQGTLADSRRGPTDSRGLHIRCPHCRNAVELLADAEVDDVHCDSCGSQFSLVDSPERNDATHALETLGHFELLSRLGVGGFGTVWKARDTELNRVVAIKIPRKGRLNTREVEQFLREARSAAHLRHPNIVPVFEVGREEDTLFIVSEYVRGVTLSHWTHDGPKSPKETAAVCAVVADALHYAHQEGVVHRDLKPSNIMLDLAGRPRLMDFGLAKRDAGEITMTMEGQILGTPAYMSPEQARGHGHWTDRRTDVYSLGVMLFELLSGELPFRGGAHAQIQQRLSEDAPNPRSLDSTLPEDLATICLKCMEQDPNRRYQAAAEVAAELRRFIEGRPIAARPISRPARLWRWAKRRPASATALALTAILAVAGPSAAVVLESQRRQIATRLHERDGLIVRSQAERNHLQQDLTAAREQLAKLTGGDLDPGQTQPWQEELIRSLLDARLDAYRKQLASMPADAEKSRAHHALAMLLKAIGHKSQSIEQYQAALAIPHASPEELARVRLSLAELHLNSGNKAKAHALLEATHKAITEDATLAERIEALWSHKMTASTASELKEKLTALSQASNAEQKIEKAWPKDVRGLYDTALRLTR